MKNERVLIADHSDVVRESVAGVVETFGAEDGHKVAGKASSIKMVEGLLKDGLKPSVAFVGNSFYSKGDGVEAARIIYKLSPATIVVAYTEHKVDWGDEFLPKTTSAQDLAKFLTELQH